MTTPVAVVIGAGPGLGRAVALKFAQEGYAVVVMARRQDSLQPLVDEIHTLGAQALPVAVDATDPTSVAAAFDKVRDKQGAPDVLIYNVGQIHIAGLLDIAPDTFEQLWKTNCYGGFLAAREVLPAMQQAGKGTVIFTGATAALRGGNRFGGFAVGKFGLRALAQSMAREFGAQGIHVVHAVIDGQIATPKNRERFPDAADNSLLEPDAIADAYWQVHQQHASAWTLELDLRPAAERF